MPFHAGVCVKELGSDQIMQGRLPFSSYDCGVLRGGGANAKTASIWSVCASNWLHRLPKFCPEGFHLLAIGMVVEGESYVLAVFVSTFANCLIREIFDLVSQEPIMKTLSLLFCLLALTAAAADKPYDESADAKQDLKHALATASNSPVIVVFGANWCPDCLALDKAMKDGASAALLKRDFKIVKVDVGHFDKNEDLAASCSVPIKKGIPAVAILSPKGDPLYVTKEGELASAGKMSDDGIYQFFKNVTAATKKN
jgi:thioredoxin 1